MSCQKGNTSRTRAQKHKNATVFKNNLHDNCPCTRFMNNLVIVNVCERCKNILEWKIKYKKYKQLTGPKRCTKCQQKTIKHAYHVICTECATSLKVCPKCGQEKVLVEAPIQDFQRASAAVSQEIKALPDHQKILFNKFMSAMEEGAKGKVYTLYCTQLIVLVLYIKLASHIHSFINF